MENTHPCIVSSSGGEVVRRCRGQLHFNQTQPRPGHWRESFDWRLDRRLLNPSRNSTKHISISSSAPHQTTANWTALLQPRRGFEIHYIMNIFSLLRWKGKSEEEGLFTNQLFWNEKWIILTDLNWLKYYLLGPRWQRGWRTRPRELRQTNTTKSI